MKIPESRFGRIRIHRISGTLLEKYRHVLLMME